MSKDGKVLIYGSDGAAGARGSAGDAYRGGNGGGGGGGAPGNHGGCVIVSTSILGQADWPQVVAHGGVGGAPGDGGTGWHQSGQRGDYGEAGNNGRFLPKRYISPV